MIITVASHNLDKIKEMSNILQSDDIEFVSMKQRGFVDEIVENDNSYKGNALLKARAVHKKLGGFVLADDSGLSLDVLQGYPGIYSARFAGIDTAYGNKIDKLWELLKPYPEDQWQGAFHCAIAFIDCDGTEYIFEEECRGLILHEMRGDNGFGYDPIFYVEEYQMTTAEMSTTLKNKISHRGKAMHSWYLWFKDKYM